MNKPTYKQLVDFIFENFTYNSITNELKCRWIEDTDVYDANIIQLFEVAVRQQRICEIEDELLQLQTELRELELEDCV